MTQFANIRNGSIFTGTFTVRSVRHVGNFRQASGTSWITILDMYFNPGQQGAPQ
jgi:hypothetical protein